MRKLIIDFETASACDLKLAGAARYSEDITTEVLSLSYGFAGEPAETWVPGQTIPSDFDAAQQFGYIIVAHNVGFEKSIWRNILMKQYGWPEIPNERWEDTGATCAMKAIPLKLEKATMALRLPTCKDKEGSRITRQLSKPNKKGFYTREKAILERVYAYNRQDVLETDELLSRIGSLPPEERLVWLLDQKINERGVGFDLELVSKMQEVVDKATLPLVDEFAKLTSGLKPTQTQKIKVWMSGQGVLLASLNKETIGELLGEEDSEEDLERDLGAMPLPELPPNVHRALTIRSIVGSASVKKLARISACVCMDGRARGLLQYHGAGPGRWAGRLLQPHNFPRGTIENSKGKKPSAEVLVPLLMSGDPDFVQMTMGEPIETVVSSLRHVIQAAKNHTLLSGDFAGIEARVVLALSGQYDKVTLMALGKDIYCDMGGAIHGRTITKENDPDERQDGKNAVLGLGFQMGWKKFKLKYAKDKSDEFCQSVVSTYREEWAPKVPETWYGLGDASLNAVKTLKPHSSHGVEYRLEDGWLTARLPSGRKLWYFNPQVIKKAMPWDENDIRFAWTYQQTKTGQFKTIDAFGGLLTENVVQGLARDLMVHTMFKLEENGFPIILTVHDEIVCEPETVNADEKAFKEIMEDRPQWAKDLQIPIAVETWKADRYKK